MKQSTLQIVMLVGLGMLLTDVANELKNLQTWGQALEPHFVAAMIGATGGVMSTLAARYITDKE